MSTSRLLTLLRFSVTVFLLLLAACAFTAEQGNSPKPFSKDDLIKLLKGNVSPKRIGELVQERGIDFALTAETEADLRRVGGDDALLSSLHSLVPKAADATSSQPAVLLITSTHGGARVYIDDEPVGTTSLQGRLKLSTLHPGAHHLRLTLDDYADGEREFEMTRGQSTSVELTLSRQTPSALAPGRSDGQSATQQEIELWKEIENSKKVQDFQSYLSKYPNGTFSQPAKERIATLQQPQAMLPHLENTSWDAVYWDSRYDEPSADDKQGSKRTFNLLRGSTCTTPKHKTCTWKVEGGIFYLRADETDLEWAVEYSGGINGELIEGTLTWIHDQTHQATAKFRAQLSSGAR